jgi:threonine dehydrogenase-like Zn-dependent dehydrogenase
MRGTVLHAPGDVRVEERDDPKITAPTDAVIRLSATCVCGSDLWPYRGVDTVEEPVPMGHEYVGVVEAVGEEVTTVRPGQFVVGSFVASDNTCELCRAGYQSSCVQRTFMNTSGAQAELMRVPLAGAPAGTSATSASPTTSHWTGGSCSSPRCTCTAVLPRFASTCRSSST